MKRWRCNVSWQNTAHRYGRCHVSIITRSDTLSRLACPVQLLLRNRPHTIAASSFYSSAGFSIGKGMQYGLRALARLLMTCPVHA
jgi:hypothetical protein